MLPFFLYLATTVIGYSIPVHMITSGTLPFGNVEIVTDQNPYYFDIRDLSCIGHVGSFDNAEIIVESVLLGNLCFSYFAYI